jgi:hypothetical protein
MVLFRVYACCPNCPRPHPRSRAHLEAARAQARRGGRAERRGRREGGASRRASVQDKAVPHQCLGDIRPPSASSTCPTRTGRCTTPRGEATCSAVVGHDGGRARACATSGTALRGPWPAAQTHAPTILPCCSLIPRPSTLFTLSR